MNLDVVGVAVAAVPVVDGEHVGTLVAEQGRKTTRCLVEVGLQERSRVAVALPAGHARISVTELLDAVDSERICGGERLGAAAIDQRLPVGEIVGCLAERTIGCDDEHHSVAVGMRPGHRAARGDRLVVGVSVEADECAHSGLLHGAGFDELFDPTVLDTPVAEHLDRVLAVVRRRPVDRCVRAAEPRGR